MKYVKHMVILFVSYILQILESHINATDGHLETFFFIFITTANAFVFVSQLIYIFLISIQSFYKNWMDIIFYFAISLITSTILYYLTGIKYTFGIYFLISLAMEALNYFVKGISTKNFCDYI